MLLCSAHTIWVDPDLVSVRHQFAEMCARLAEQAYQPTILSLLLTLRRKSESVL